MGVYVVKNNRNGLWDNALGSTIGSLVNNGINGMFERDAEARKIRRSRDFYKTMTENVTPQMQTTEEPATNVYLPAEENDYGAWGKALGESGIGAQPNGGLWETNRTTTQSVPGTGLTRDNIMRGLAKSGATPEEAKVFFDFIGSQLEYQDKLGYQDNVASRVGNLNMDVRNDPVGAAQGGLIAQAYGTKPEDLWKYTAPNYELKNVDLGNRNLVQSFDPHSGEIVSSEQRYGLNPTKKYQSDADTQQANIAAGASKYVADRNYAGHWVPSYQPVYGEDGTIYSFNNKGGAPVNTGVKSYPRGSAAQGTKPLTTQQKMELTSKTTKVFENNDATPEQKWDYIVRMSGGDNEALQAMMQGAFADGKIPMAAAEYLKTGNTRMSGKGDGAQASTIKIFPQSQVKAYAAANGVSEDKAIQSLKKDFGYVIQ